MKLLAYLFVWLSLGLPLAARDLAAYRVGDVADADVITPVALDVPDAAATAAMQLAKAQQCPAIFRDFPAATNEMVHNFTAAFARTRTNFLAELAADLSAAPLTDSAIASADFSRLVTAFRVQHRDFPITDELAADWARGRSGDAARQKFGEFLLKYTPARMCPDTLPKGMVVGDMVRLVPVTAANERLSFDTVQQAPAVPAKSLTTLSNAQDKLRQDLSPTLPLAARALAAFLQPNCLPDELFTRLTRGAAVAQMIVAIHFDAGDAIVRQGETIDVHAQAALVALSERLAALPPKPAAATNSTAAAPVTAVVTPAHGTEASVPVTPPAPAPAPAKAAAASAPPSAPAKMAASAPPSVSPAHVPHEKLITVLTAISATALLLAAGQLLRERKRAVARLTAAQTSLPLDSARPDLTPQVAQAVREAVQQELAQQRRELLVAQQAATDEIAALVKRLDELQMPMQQRLQAYETHIQNLEKELAARNEENRTLLKVKLDAVRQQLANEQAGLVPAIPAPTPPAAGQSVGA